MSISKVESHWPKRASTGVRILPISMSFFHFSPLIWLALTKLEVNLAIETHNSIFLKILTVWLIPLCIPVGALHSLIIEANSTESGGNN